jgi:hypothetical protein
MISDCGFRNVDCGKRLEIRDWRFEVGIWDFLKLGV